MTIKSIIAPINRALKLIKPPWQELKGITGSSAAITRDYTYFQYWVYQLAEKKSEQKTSNTIN